MKALKARSDLRIALLYASFGAVWILFSDRLLLVLTSDLATLSRMQTYKGWAFVISSAFLLFVLLRHELRLRKKAEDEFLESDKRYRLISENSTDVIWTLNPTTERFTYVSPSVLRLRGFTAEEVMAESIEAALTPESYRMIAEMMPLRVAAFQAGDVTLRTATTEVEQTRKDGSMVSTEVATTLLTNDQGQVVEILGITRDITERKRAELALQKSEKRYRTLVEMADDVILLTDAMGKHLYRNRAYYTSLGFDVGEEVALNGYARVHPDDLEPVHALTEKLLSVGTATIEYRVRHKLGHWVIRQAKTVTLYDAEHQPEAFLSIIRDITDRKLAEEKLRESEERYRQLLEMSPVGIAIHADGKLVFTNAAGAAIIGAKNSEEVVGKPILEFVHPQSRAAAAERMLRMLAGETGLYPVEERYLRLDGQEVPVEVIAVPVTYQGRTAAQIVVQDITKRKQAETKINRQLNRLKALHLVDLAISSSFDLSAVLQTVLQQVMAQLGVATSAIRLFHPKLQTLEYIASRGFHSNVLSTTKLGTGEDCASRAVLERKTIRSSELRHNYPSLPRGPQVAQEIFQDCICVPLIAKGEVKGVLEIYQHEFLPSDPEWLEFLETLAGQAAVAIDNVQLFKSLSRVNVQLEKHVLERTSELQQANLELEHTNRMIQEFLGSLSEKFCIRLNVIIHETEALLGSCREKLDEDQNQSLKTLETDARQLLDLAKNIGALSNDKTDK
jgi:PAS domain S-box-containing protein